MSSLDLLVTGGPLATMVSGGAPWGAVPDGAVAVREGRIVWVGPRSELPAGLAGSSTPTVDVGGRWVTPGLIDSHTHLVFGGNRAREFEARLGGATYEEIAHAGGGILSTVAATRAASDQELLDGARGRVEALCAAGVTTVEIKSGYGLHTASELRMLRVARALGRDLPVTVQTTLLAAHALPPEYRGEHRSGYVDLVCSEMIPRAVEEALADAVDAFCEGIAFTPEECARVFESAASFGLPLRLHADQLSDGGGAALAARYGARSADHLEYASEEGVRAMAAAGTVAVLLPGAFLFLNGVQRPPVDALRRHGVPIAVATDLNPGSSPVLSPLLAMSLSCVLFGLTPEEALAAMTRVAARVLGLEGEAGTLEVGAWADLALWDVDDPSELSYWMGGNPCVGTLHHGVPGPSAARL